MITFISSDGVEFTVTKQVAQYMGLIKDPLDDNGDSFTQILNMNSKVLEKVNEAHIFYI
jgi:S-phase kinase-associated protein 1